MTIVAPKRDGWLVQSDIMDGLPPGWLVRDGVLVVPSAFDPTARYRDMGWRRAVFDRHDRVVREDGAVLKSLQANDNHARKGDWLQCYTGGKFYPLDPRIDEVRIADIAHSLSMQCRYAGHCTRFYSVAEHSVLLARHVAPEHRFWALMHDASEAYLVDVPRPVKGSLGGYKDIERSVMAVVAEAYGLRGEMPAEVHDADIRICVDEKAQNMAPGPMWGIDGLEPLGIQLQFWSPAKAEAEFMDVFAEIMRGR